MTNLDDQASDVLPRELRERLRGARIGIVLRPGEPGHQSCAVALAKRVAVRGARVTFLGTLLGSRMVKREPRNQRITSVVKIPITIATSKP